MSSSLSFSAMGDICASFRRPSRNLISVQCVYIVGWPAIEGMPGIVALPAGPWHPAHGSALRRPASASAEKAGAAPAARTMTASAAPVNRASVFSESS
jgi:hypothetical protein